MRVGYDLNYRTKRKFSCLNSVSHFSVITLI